MVTSDCKNLEQKLDLYLDGKQIELPELESIVILNIPSWGAGVNLWGLLGNNTRPAQSYHDGILEVLGIYSSFHIAQLQVGLSTPLKLGQAKTVEVNLVVPNLALNLISCYFRYDLSQNHQFKLMVSPGNSIPVL